MQNKFLSKSVPRGTRTIWRYLGALFILFTFAIGNVWAADITVTPPTPNNASNPFSTGLYVMSFSGTGSKLSSGAITTGTKGAVITINFQATKSDMYIKTITFNSLGNGTLSSGDGTFDGQVFTATGNKNSVNVVLTSGSGQKGTVKVTNVVVNTGTNVVETITFTGVDSGDGQKATFTSSAATSALSSITTDASAFSVSSGKLSWANGKKVILTAESNIKYVAFSIADGKMYDSFSAAETTYNSANYSWSGSSKTVTLTNGSGGGREIKGLYVIIDPVVKHHVTYSLGGDYGTTPTQADVAEGGKFTLHNGTTGITAPENKTFAGWNDGTTTYEGGAEYTMGTSDVELTAQWATSYDISYDTGTYGTGEIAGGKKAEDVAYTLSSSMFTRENYLQVGWATSDGASRSYMIGGSYTTNAAQTFYPAWAEKDTYVAAFHYDSENPTTPPAGWTFANAGTYTNTSATVAYVGKFTAEGETTASGKGMDPNHIAFAKSADADAVYDLGYVTTVSAVTGTLMIGSTSAKVASIDYLAADGSTVLHSFNITHNKVDWGANNFNETEVVPNVRYIRINGKDFWQVLGAFSVTYGSLVTKYNVTFDKNNEGASGTQATLKYAEGAEVTLPATSTFTAPTNMEFDAWTSTDVTISNNNFTMPGNDVVIKATWKYLPKLRLEAGEGATGEAVETYHKAGSSVAVPAKPEDFSNGTKEFTGWVYSTPVEITDGAFPMPATGLTLTAQWASATDVAQIVGGDSYETLAQAIAAATDGQTIQLLQDIEQADGVLINKDLVLDLNGKTYTCTNGNSYNNRAIKITAGNVTITNGTITAVPTANFNGGCYGGLRIEGESANVTCTNVTFNNGRQYGLGIKLVTGQLRMEECTVNSANGGGGLEVAGTADVINCTFTQTGLDPQAWISTCLAVCYGGVLNVQGGTYTSDNYSLYVYSSGGEMDVENGSFIGNIVNTIDHNTYPDATGTINISGGTFEGVGDAPIAFTVGANYTDINISGGTFDAPVAEAYCAENYAPKDNGDNTYGVKPLAQTFSLEDLVTAQGTGANYTTYLNNLGWTVANADALDNLNTDKDYDNYPYLGLKFKNAAGYVAGEVEGGKLLTIKLGHMAGVAHLMVDDVKKMELDGVDAETPKVHYYYVENTANVKLLMANAGSKQTCVLKAITVADPFTVTFDANGGEAVASRNGTPSITLPSTTKGTESFLGWFTEATGGEKIGDEGESYTPTADITLHAQWEAVSTDARLSAITFSSDAGTLAPAFDPEVTEYTYTMPYGTTAIPTITGATKANANAQAPVIGTAAAAWGNAQTVKGVAQSGAEKTYTITMVQAPKDGVEIIGVVTTGGTNKTVSGLYQGDASVSLAGDKKIGNNNYIYVTLASDYTFEETDVLVVDVDKKSDLPNDPALEITTGIGNIDGSVWKSIANADYELNLVTIPLKGIAANQTSIGLKRSDHQNTWVNGLKVYRPMNPVLTAITINGRDGEIDALDDKHFTVTIPNDANLASLTVVPTIVRNAAHATTPEAVISNEGAWVLTADGDNTYRIMDKDGDYTDYTITLVRDVLKHTVRFMDGTSEFASALVADGESPVAPATDPTKEDYLFQGWAETVDGDVITDWSTISISAAKDFYAKWVSDGAIKLIEAGAINTTNFVTGGTLSSGTVSVDEVDYKYITLAGTNGEIGSASNVTTDRFVMYHATTTKTKIQIHAYANGNARQVRLSGLVEGASTLGLQQTINVAKNDDELTEYFSFDSDKHRTFYITIPSSADDVYLLQVKVIESGEPLAAIGTAGTSFNFNKGRLFAPQSVATSFDGIDIKTYNKYAALSTEYAELSAGAISFYVPNDVCLSVASNANGTNKYYVTNEVTGTDNETTTANAEFNLTGGKTWYIRLADSNKRVRFTNIAFTAPKCEKPTISAQPESKQTFGPGNLTATVVADAPSDGGTLKYQWYDAATDEEVENATEATLTTTTPGTYYVIVTNTLADHSDNSVKSANATLGYRVMNDATLSVLKYGETAIALEADKYEYRVDLEMGTTVVPTLSATATMAPYATVEITDATEFVDYEATSTVTVTSEDATANKTYTVKFYVDHIYTALVPVTGSTTWNWKNAATEDATINDVPNKGAIIANYLSGADFEKIEGKENEKAFRNQNDGVYQGTHLHFTTTVPGKVKFYFRAPSSGEESVITVINNGKEVRVDSTGNSFKWSREVVVYGDVVIEMENKKEGRTDTRVQQIVFTEATPNYPRPVSNNIGTLCVDHNVLAGGALGATFYQIASRNETYPDKIDFEEVMPGEELKAGQPYIFKSNTGKIELYYGETVADGPVAVRGMHGVLTDGESIAITEENKRDILYISQNDLYNCTNLTSLSLVKNRAYIVMSEVPTYAEYQASQSNSQPNNARRRVTLSMNGTNSATDIDNIFGNDTKAEKVLINGQLFILRGSKMFDATGRLVK